MMTANPNEGLPGWSEGSPWHAGEQAMQARAGVRDRMEMAGRRVLRDFMPDQHREFFTQLPSLIVGSLDAERRPWASIVVGRPGFIATPDPRLLTIDAAPLPGDPLAQNLKRDAPLGLLGLQPETRRRNRANGRVVSADAGGFVLQVNQSFGNCPQYIQARQPFFVDTVEMAPAAHPETAQVSERAATLIRQADTFFIATAAAGADGYDPVHGVDASHRGGRPGFVKLTVESGQSVLTVPDFSGNNFFNTLGNITANPRAGLLFIDYIGGHALMLTGSAGIVWNGPEVDAFEGALRLMRFVIERGVWLEGVLPLRWSAPAYAPQLVATGIW
jgi:predicted pyridoxine 5'-phosphate oxidase superfamily flavin-nucleotide-binding protein